RRSAERAACSQLSNTRCAAGVKRKTDRKRIGSGRVLLRQEHSVRKTRDVGRPTANQFLGEVWVNERGSRLPHPLTPRCPWLRGLDLHQRPLGYEPFSNEDRSQRATNNGS